MAWKCALVAAIVFYCAPVVAIEPARSPEARAVAFLAAEVPRWAAENKCYSCHNNGDGARALMATLGAGQLADRKSLADTLAFLAAPDHWDANGPEGPFKDKKLARIQFAAALADARAAKLIDDPRAMATAARLVAELQTADGSWQLDASGALGSPATYGPVLATAIAVMTLEALDARSYQPQIAKGRAWLETTEVKNVLGAAAVLYAIGKQNTPAANKQRSACLELLGQGVSPEGGWGPFVNSPPEVFDTALVVLALRRQPRQEDTESWIADGRAFLLARQSDDGSWPATTRPSGGDSYAQQLSTTAWATQALLATMPAEPQKK